MGRRLGVAALVAAVFAFSIVGIAAAAPDNKNSQTIGMVCDHGVGSVTAVTIEHNSAGGLNIIDPGPGTYEIKRVVIGGQLVYENPGFAGRDLVSCRPVTVDGGPLPPGPEVIFGGILNVRG